MKPPNVGAARQVRYLAAESVAAATAVRHADQPRSQGIQCLPTLIPKLLKLRLQTIDVVANVPSDSLELRLSEY